MTSIAVLGAGAWGSALACVACRAGHDVTLWGRSQSLIDEIGSEQLNRRYLGDLRLEEGIRPTTDIANIGGSSDIIILSVPTQTLRETLMALGPVPYTVRFISTSKGIDRESGKLPSELVRTQFPDNPVACLSGPSFAADVVANKPTAVTVASNEFRLAEELARLVSTPAFRCYSATDIRGVELGGALKNVLALAVGAARGMGLGASAEAALIARGFAEVNRISIAMGARAETLSGLSGLGDLVLTCSSTQSRNFSYGIAMGQGAKLEGLPLAEGVHTASIAFSLAKKTGIQTPIIEAVVNVLEKRVTAREAVHTLLTRPLKREI